jgi:choline transporter-like protein 2/4/5
LDGGPLKKRSCTDIICLLIFAAYVGFMIYLFIYGLIRGDFERITNGYDAAGNVCGDDDNEAIANVEYSGR